jgi:pyruvate/2-oxoglutarate dehydrogenase complex dihydrolipoamide dehydrogenase (E3) component
LTERFDIVVIGAGAGGLTVAAEARKQGAKIALISNGLPGGDCSYYGCLPTKTLIHSAKVLNYIRRSQDFGLPAVKIEPDFAAVMAHKDRVIGEITEHASFGPWEKQGFSVLRGEGHFVSANEIEVGGTIFGAGRFVIATGSEPSTLPIPGLKEAGFITNVEAVDLQELPRRLAILGGGPIGLEFAQLFRRFGVAVTVIEMAQQILPKEEPEVVAKLQAYLEEEGIVVHTGFRLECVATECGQKILTAVAPGSVPLRIEVDEILVAVGRRPVAEDLKPGMAGVKLEKGWVVVDDALQTTAPNIWAVGDCTGKFLFTHVADYHARIVANNMFAPKDALRRVDYTVLPAVTFTDPELARVGMTEAEAMEKGITTSTATFDFGDLDRARLMLETKGLIKVVVDENKRIVGASVLGPQAGELILEFALAIRCGLTSHDLLSMIHAYPTLSEAVRWSMWPFENSPSSGI